MLGKSEIEEFTEVNEHFYDKQNVEIGVFLSNTIVCLLTPNKNG